MIYLDSSALLKLVLPESFHTDLYDFLAQEPAVERISSALAEVEVILAASRHDPALTQRAEAVVSQVALLEISPAIRRRAAGYGPLGLRSLAAIHVASAAGLHEQPTQHTVVTYDHRMAAACRALDLGVVSPGYPSPATSE